jgi:hypothetical protein
MTARGARVAGADVEELPPCGRCKVVGSNRLDSTVVIDPDGRIVEIIARCPTCHPNAGEGCDGGHVVPPGQACPLCLHDIGPRAERPYGGAPPRPAAPYEPLDLDRCSIKEMAAERRELLTEPMMPRTIRGRWEETALRDLAARQAANARHKAKMPGRHAK